MLTQYGHLPQALVGESVEVVRPVLPSGPALGPTSLHQLICRTDRSQRGRLDEELGTRRRQEEESRVHLEARVLLTWWMEKEAVPVWRQKQRKATLQLPPPSQIPDFHWTFPRSSLEWHEPVTTENTRNPLCYWSEATSRKVQSFMGG